MKQPKRKSTIGRKQFDGKDYDTVIQKLETAWSLDCSDAEAAALADISCAALSDFLKRRPEISERKARLKQKPFLAARKAITQAMEGGDAEMALKFLERKLKTEFSTRHELDIKEKDKFDDLTDAQLALIAAGKASPADFIK